MELFSSRLGKQTVNYKQDNFSNNDIFYREKIETGKEYD